MHRDSKLIFEAFMKSRPADYEDQLDKKEAYKSSLLRKDESNKSVFLLINNETQFELNIYGIYSTREMAEQKMAEFGKDKNLAVIERPLDSEPNFYYSDSQYENSESQITSPEQIARPEDRMAVAGVRAMGNYLKTLPDPNEAFKQAAQRWMKKNNQLLNLDTIEYFDKYGNPVFKKTAQGNFD